MSKARDRWEANPDRGVDGRLRVAGKHGAATVGHVEDGEGAVLLVWPGARKGRAPLRLVDPLQGDPGQTVVAMFGGQREAGR